MGKLDDARMWIGRRHWDAVRFGATPRGVLGKVRGSEGPKIVCISIPKAGTHLLERTICLHPQLHRKVHRKILSADLSNDPEEMDELLERTRDGQMILGHIPYSDEMRDVIRRHGAQTLFIVRDPRDSVVSHAHYIGNFEGHAWHGLVAELPELSSRIRLFIEGSASIGVESIGEMLEAFEGWLEAADQVIRYEELVDDDTRRVVTGEMFARLGVPLGERELDQLTARMVSPVSPTFRKGRAGDGRQSFDENLEELYLEVAGPYLPAYGYG